MISFSCLNKSIYISTGPNFETERRNIHFRKKKIVENVNIISRCDFFTIKKKKCANGA